MAKFWLEPAVELAGQYNLASKDLRAIEALVSEHEQELRAAWDRHFGQ